MALPLLPLAVASLFIILTLTLLYQHLQPKLPPGPRPWPIAGNLYDMKLVHFRCFAEWAEKYGPIMSVWFGTALHVVVSSSELAKEVLKDYDHKLADRTRTRLSARFSRDGKDMIWADYGPHYVKVRKLCTLELFSGRRLEALRFVREEEVHAMVLAIFRDCNHSDNIGKSLTIREYLSAVSFNNIARLLFGKRFMNSEGELDEQGLELRAIMTNGNRLGATTSPANYVWWLKWLFRSDEETFNKHASRRDRLTMAIMEECKISHKKQTKQHFADALLTLKDEYDLSEENVIGLLWDMIAAGMDTTVINAEWTMAEVLRNPRVQEKVHEELDRVIRTDRVLTETDFPNLPYLHCVVKEGFRMHPPTPLMLPHKASSDVKIGGYDIPKGTTIKVNVWAIGRDPKIWKDPLEFRPERFLDEDVDMKGHDFRLLPFGAGRRVCPGAQLGINLVQSMLGHLLHQFTWRLPDGVKPNDIDMSESPGAVTYMRTPVRGVATPRLPSNMYKPKVVDL